MTAILPQGLIDATTTLDQYAYDDSDIYVTNSDVLRKFWKVFAVQSDVTHDHASTRSRNLFWRVWSSPTMARSMTSARLVRLWRQCSQGFDLTPIGQRPTPPPAPVTQDFPATRLVRTRSSSLSPTSDIRPSGDSSPRAGQNTEPSLQDFRFPSTIQDRHGPRRHPTVERAAGTNQRQSDDTSGSTSHTTSESSSRPALSRTASGGRLKSGVSAATAGKSRARPQLPRRKSSSTKSPAVGNGPKSPRRRSEAAGSSSTSQMAGGSALHPPSRRGPPPGLPILPSTTGGAGFLLPSASSWQSVDSAADKPFLATTAPVLTSSELVNRDFRGKFVETQKRLASSTNLTALDRMRKTGSIVRFADEDPQDLRKGKEKEIVPPLQHENIGPAGQRTSIATEALFNDDEASSDDHMELPRTKSQLSLLIKIKRDENGSQDLGPDEKAQEPKGKDKDTGKAQSKEEELLSMARGDGVTKAGGVQVPKSLRLSEHDDPGYTSPSSPEPLF